MLVHGGQLTIDLNFGPLLGPLAAGGQVIAVELQGRGRTAGTGRPMTIEALAGDVVALLDHLGIGPADLSGFSLGGLVACAVALGAPARAGQLIVASADARRPPGRESAPLGGGRLPTAADFRAWRGAYEAVAPDPGHLEELAARTSEMVHEFAGRAGWLRCLQVPILLIVGDRGFSPLPDVVGLFELLPDAQLAVLPGDHARRRDAAARRGRPGWAPGCCARTRTGTPWPTRPATRSTCACSRPSSRPRSWA